MRTSPSTSSLYSEKSTKVCLVLNPLHIVLTPIVCAAGAKGRAAFCNVPTVPKEKRKETDYSEYPLTPHGEMLFALMRSGICSYPHPIVGMQFFETAARYADFFKVRKEFVLPLLEAMVDAR